MRSATSCMGRENVLSFTDGVQRTFGDDIRNDGGTYYNEACISSSLARPSPMSRCGGLTMTLLRWPNISTQINHVNILYKMQVWKGLYRWSLRPLLQSN